MFDLVAIGTGTAAKKVALTCRRAGWRVAVVDSRPYGGTCALRGCDPKSRPPSGGSAASPYVRAEQAIVVDPHCVGCHRL